MSRIEDALSKARLLRSIVENNDKARMPRSNLEKEPGINVLIISRDPHISNIINNISSLSQDEIIVSDNIVKGMKSLFEEWPVEIDEYELKFTARMLDLLCCNCVSAAPD